MRVSSRKKPISSVEKQTKQKLPKRAKRLVVEEPRKEGTKRRKLEELPSTTVGVKSGFKAVSTSQGGVKTRKMLTINSQPEPVDEIWQEGEEVKGQL